MPYRESKPSERPSPPPLKVKQANLEDSGKSHYSGNPRGNPNDPKGKR